MVTTENGNGFATYDWDPITGATSGDALELNNAAGVVGAVQVIDGTAGSVALQGSLDGVNWAALSDLQGSTIALTALTQLAEFSTAARYIRPLGNAGSAAAVVRVVLRG